MSQWFLIAHETVGVEALGLSRNLILYSTLALLVLVTVALRITMPTPAFGPVATPGPPEWPADHLHGVAGLVLRALGLAGLAAILVSGWLGSEQIGANPTYIAMYIAFWIGGQLMSLLLGDWWRALSPFDTIAAWLNAQPESSGETDTQYESRDWWLPALLLLTFGWLWLAWFDGAINPRVDAGWLTAYTAAMLIGAAIGGRRWVRRNEVFGVLFGLIAVASPVDWSGPRLRLRNPLRSIAAKAVSRREAAALCVLAGTTFFDAIGASAWWGDLVGTRSLNTYTVFNTFGLIGTTLAVGVVWTAAARLAATLGEAPEDDALATAPLVLAAPLIGLVALAAVLHELDSLLVNGQNLLALASDPLARGWNLLGTARLSINPQPLSPELEVAVSLVGMLAALLVSSVGLHDRCVATYGLRGGARATWAMLGFMILAAAAGLIVLLGV